jgi:predicted CXXCH cytochrome family protein
MPRSKRHLLLFGLLLAILPVLTGGCSREARHQVLTILFTGVPPLDWVPPEVAVAESAQAARERRQLEMKRAQASKGFSGMYAHGPYAGEACAECHIMSSGGFGFRGGSSSEGEKKSIVPGQFTLPIEELCVACHAGKGNAAAQAAGLSSHGPGWNCVSCHHPHNGREPYFLKVAANDLCRQCHADGYIHTAELHEGLVDCLKCHNPHMGRDASMLRDDLREAY